MHPITIVCFGTIFVANEVTNNITIYSMARPIRETPILTGEDAIRFMSDMSAVDNYSSEMRAANRAAFVERCQAARRTISVCI